MLFEHPDMDDLDFVWDKTEIIFTRPEPEPEPEPDLDMGM
jgi:hypothetical protein